MTWFVLERCNDFVFCNDDVRKIAASSAAMTEVTCTARTEVTHAAMTGGVVWQ